VANDPNDTGRLMEVVLVAVVSLDGCLTRHDESGVAGWASTDDQQHFFDTLKTCDASIMGSATYLAARDHIRKNLSARRRRIVLTRTPSRFEHDGEPGILEFSNDDPVALVDRLRADGHQRCALLGGGQIYSRFLADHLVDTLLLTIEPMIFGTGIRLAGIDRPIDAAFKLDDVTRLGADTVLMSLSRRP
jgi:dihydrofolate reductase